MNTRILVVSAALAITASGCSTMSADQCASADWYAYGVEDGSQGRTMAMANRRGEACYKHGFAMDQERYRDGRDAGLAAYCVPQRGYSLGESGKQYNGVCSNHGEAAFRVAYDQGYSLFRFTSAVQHAGQELRNARSEQSKLASRLNKYASGYRDEDVSTSEHNEKVLNIWSRRNYLENVAIPYWLVEERFARRELEEYRVRVATGDPRAEGMRPSGFDGPPPYTGPTRNDAIAMVAEAFNRIGSGSAY